MGIVGIGVVIFLDVVIGGVLGIVFVILLGNGVEVVLVVVVLVVVLV